MRYALNLAEDGRILSATYPQYAPAGAAMVDALPEGDIYEYRYVNGVYVHDPLPEPAPVEPEGASEDAVWDAMAAAYNEGVQSA